MALKCFINVLGKYLFCKGSVKRMVKSKAAENRLFANVWICMRCNGKNRSTPGKKPNKCRKCNSHKLRLKRKKAKKT